MIIANVGGRGHPVEGPEFFIVSNVETMKEFKFAYLDENGKYCEHIHVCTGDQSRDFKYIYDEYKKFVKDMGKKCVPFTTVSHGKLVNIANGEDVYVPTVSASVEYSADVNEELLFVYMYRYGSYMLCGYAKYDDGNDTDTQFKKRYYAKRIDV